MPPPLLGDSCFQADASPVLRSSEQRGERPRFKFGMCSESCQPPRAHGAHGWVLWGAGGHVAGSGARVGLSKPQLSHLWVARVVGAAQTRARWATWTRQQSGQGGALPIVASGHSALGASNPRTSHTLDWPSQGFCRVPHSQRAPCCDP